jgi:hypothetical protein
MDFISIGAPVENSRPPDRKDLASHPIVVLLCGVSLSALLGTLVIPYVSGRISDQKLLQEERAKEAVQIIEEINLVDHHLQSMQSTYEDFATNTRGSKKEIWAAQKQLRGTLTDEERVFNDHAWYWYQTLDIRSVLLKLPDKNRRKLQSLLGQYHKNLEDSTKALEPVRKALLSKGYKSDDRDTWLLLKASQHHLLELGQSRDDMAGQLALLFFQP